RPRIVVERPAVVSGFPDLLDRVAALVVLPRLPILAEPAGHRRPGFDSASVRVVAVHAMALDAATSEHRLDSLHLPRRELREALFRQDDFDDGLRLLGEQPAG